MYELGQNYQNIIRKRELFMKRKSMRIMNQLIQWRWIWKGDRRKEQKKESFV